MLRRNVANTSLSENYDQVERTRILRPASHPSPATGNQRVLRGDRENPSNDGLGI